MEGFTFKREVPEPHKTVKNLSLLSKKFDYPIYYSSYYYVYDTKNNRLSEFETDLVMTESENMQKLIDYYKFQFQIESSDEDPSDEEPSTR